MDIADLIVILEEAHEPHRKYDGQIGAFFGWQRIEQEDEERKVVWLSDKGRPARVPDFSTNIDSIAALISSIARDWAVAVKWDPGGRCEAVISSDGEIREVGYGATPALALCSATLRLRKRYM